MRIPPRCTRLVAALGIVVLVGAPSASAQSASQRTVLERFRDSLATVRDTVGLREVERVLITAARRDRTDAMLHLRLGFTSLRLGELGVQRAHDDAGSEFQWTVDLQPKWPYAWYGLGLAELASSETTVSLVQGLQSMLGKDALTRSANAFAKSAEVDPAFVFGLSELVNTALRQRINARMDVALAALRRAARTPAARHPDVLLARARIEREAGSLDSSRAALAPLLALESPPPVSHLEAARTGFLVGQASAPREWYRGLLVADSATLAQYRADLGMLVPEALLGALPQASPQDRVETLRSFWRRREIADLHPEDARLAEHYRRLDYARRHFRLVSPNRQFAIIERYRSNQDIFDDRGIIYIRHGQPDDRAFFNAPDLDPNESWRYDREDGPLVFHFVARQDVQDFRLVESLFDVLGFAAATALRNERDIQGSQVIDGLLRSREFLAPVYGRMISAGRGGTNEMLTDERAQGARAIARGTTTDSWPLRFEESIQASALALVVGAEADGPHVQLAVAIPGTSLSGQPLADGMGYAVRVRASIIAPDGTRIASVDTVRSFRARTPIPSDGRLLIRVPMSAPPGTYALRAAIETDAGGMLRPRETITVPALDSAGIGLSDLAVGTRRVALWWSPGAGDTIWVNPLRSFTRQDAMELHYEVTGLAPGTSYRTEVAIRKEGGGSVLSRLFGGGAAVRLRSTDVHPGGIARVHRELDLSRLDPGSYSLEVRVRGPDGPVAERRARFVVVP
jgi:GWxTD domain-containing protein